MVKNNGFGQIVEEGDNAGFYKILRKEDLSSEIVRIIPHNLIRSIPGNSSSFKMVLKVPWGGSWPVKISKNPSFHYMEDRGWNQFVKDNALGGNEYLTFIHEENMCFNVNIYEPDGTEMLKSRESATIHIASQSGLRKREASKNIHTNVKEKEIESCSESSYPGLKTAGGRLGKKKAEETEKSKKNKKKKKKKKKKVDTGRNDSEAGTSSLVPEFDLTIKRSHLLFLSIPKKFVDTHMPKETKTFKIHYFEGEEPWEVLYLVTDVQSRFSAGWSRLAKEIGLEVGEVCNFKLIKPTEMLLKISREETP